MPGNGLTAFLTIVFVFFQKNHTIPTLLDKQILFHCLVCAFLRFYRISNPNRLSWRMDSVLSYHKFVGGTHSYLWCGASAYIIPGDFNILMRARRKCNAMGQLGNYIYRNAVTFFYLVAADLDVVAASRLKPPDFRGKDYCLHPVFRE